MRYMSEITCFRTPYLWINLLEEYIIQNSLSKCKEVTGHMSANYAIFMNKIYTPMVSC